MSSSKTVYLNLQEISEVSEKDVFLKDVADVYCSDTAVQSKCRALKVYTVHGDHRQSKVLNALDVIRKLEALDSSIQVNNVGKVEFIVNYLPPHPPREVWQWCKTILICLICFSGAAFAIMTFNNDASVKDVFSKVHMLITGTESDGFTILEATYSIGLGVGILMFFNHFGKWKISTDPTPLEVEMRVYEDNISKTVIQNDSRKEKDIDVS
jgi:stage V sporulation protein AA